MTDFAFTELFLKSCDDTVSTLGSTIDSDDDSDTESTSSTSSSSINDEDEDLIQNLRDIFATPKPRATHANANARWSPKKPTLSRGFSDFKFDYRDFDFKDLSQDTNSPKKVPGSVRKAKSADDVDLRHGSRSHQTTSPEHPLTKGRWSSSFVHPLKVTRASTSDSTPRIPVKGTNKELRRTKSLSGSDRALLASLSVDPDSKQARTNARWSASGVPHHRRTNLSGSSRWNSSCSVKTSRSSKTTASVAASVSDQWSTKPPLPKHRRRRAGQGKKKEHQEGEVAKEDRAVEESREGLVLVLLPQGCRPPEEMSPAAMSNLIDAGLPFQPEEPTPVRKGQDQEEDDLEGRPSTFAADFCLPFTECFETILEETNEDALCEYETHVRASSDSALLAPKRKKSMSLLDMDMGDCSSPDTPSISGPSMQPSNFRRGSGDGSRRLSIGGHKYAPRQPRRRGSIISTSSDCMQQSESSRTQTKSIDEDTKSCHPLLDEKHPLAMAAKARVARTGAAKARISNCPAA